MGYTPLFAEKCVTLHTKMRKSGFTALVSTHYALTSNGAKALWLNELTVNKTASSKRTATPS